MNHRKAGSTIHMGMRVLFYRRPMSGPTSVTNPKSCSRKVRGLWSQSGNGSRRSRAMQDAIKALRTAVAGKKAAEAAKLLPKAYQAIDKAVKRGVIKKNAAARMKSRLSKKVK